MEPLSFFLAVGISLSIWNNELDTARKVSEASYYYLNLDERAKILEDRYVPIYLQKYGTVITIGTRALTERRITYQWSF